MKKLLIVFLCFILVPFFGYSQFKERNPGKTTTTTTKKTKDPDSDTTDTPAPVKKEKVQKEKKPAKTTVKKDVDGDSTTTSAPVKKEKPLISYAIPAQENANIYWGKDNPADKTAQIFLCGKREDVVFGYKKWGKNVSIVKYSYSDLQVMGDYPVIGKESAAAKIIPKDYAFDQIVMLKTKNYVCVTQYDKSSKENALYMQEFDNSGQLQGDLKKVVEMTARSKYNKGAFDIIISKDSSKFVLVNVPPYEKYNGEKFGFQVLDENLNVINSAEVSLPNNFKYFEVNEEGITISNDGIVYMMAKLYLQKNDKTKGESEYNYELLAINPNGAGDVTTYDLKLPEKSITDISYSLEEGKYIVCAGLYGNVKKSSTTVGQIDGVFYFRIDKESKAIESTGTKDLDKDFIADLTTQRKANKGKGIPDKFTLMDFAKRSDGGAVLVAEYRDFYETTTTTSDGHGGTYTTYIDHYIRNNIIVININPDGTIKWYANIPKKQATENDRGIYSSFMMSVNGDKMNFVFNDNADNMDPKKAKDDNNDWKSMHNPAKSTAVLVELSESGSFTKSTLFSNKENKMILEPSEALKISENQAIVPAYHAGGACCFISLGASKYKLARFEFK